MRNSDSVKQYLYSSCIKIVYFLDKHLRKRDFSIPLVLRTHKQPNTHKSSFNNIDINIPVIKLQPIILQINHKFNNYPSIITIVQHNRLCIQTLYNISKLFV